jgi:hypothetical protein
MNTFESSTDSPLNPNSTETVALTRRRTFDPSSAQEARRQASQVFARFYVSRHDALFGKAGDGTPAPNTVPTPEEQVIAERALFDAHARGATDVTLEDLGVRDAHEELTAEERAALLTYELLALQASGLIGSVTNASVVEYDPYISKFVGDEV